MKVQRKRWVCPVCSSIKLAPSRPRKDDVRRYCLPCSEESGRLVERTCPTLEAVREKKTVVRTQRAKTATAKKAAVRVAKKEKLSVRFSAKSPVNGKTVDLRQEVKKVWRAARKVEPRLREAPPKLVASRGSGSYAYTWKGEIHLAAGASWMTLAHEVAHFVRAKQGNEVRSDGKRAVHDRAFYRVLKDIVEKMVRGLTISFYEVTSWGYVVDGVIGRQVWAHYSQNIKPKIEPV